MALGEPPGSVGWRRTRQRLATDPTLSRAAGRGLLQALALSERRRMARRWNVDMETPRWSFFADWTWSGRPGTRGAQPFHSSPIDAHASS